MEVQVNKIDKKIEIVNNMKTTKELLWLDDNLNKTNFIERYERVSRTKIDKLINKFCEKAYNFNISLTDLKSRKYCVDYYVQNDKNNNSIENKEINKNKSNID